MTMRTWINMVIAAALMLGWSAGAAAELQNVQVGGELRIRGYWWRASFNDSPATPATVMPQVRWPAWCLRGRPIGDSAGGQNVISYWDWNDRGNDYKMVEHLYTEKITRLFYAFGYFKVFPARCWISCWMIVQQDNRSCR